MKPLATVLIPLLRQRPDYLAVALASALRQTVEVEVLVVTSTETPEPNRAAIADARHAHPGRLRVVELEGIGYARALNLGFREARTQRVGLLLTDDWLDPDTFEDALALDADIVSGGKRIFREDPDGTLTEILTVVRSSDDFEALPSLEQRASHIVHFLLLRRALVLEAGGVDETLGDVAGVDDYDLVWTMLEAGASVAFTATPHYNVRDHDGERLTLRPREEQLATLLRILDKHGVPDDERARIIASHARWYGKTISAGLAEAAELARRSAT